MSSIIKDRVCAELDDEFVLFLIGMRINKPWKVWTWLPVAMAMPRMLIELARNPDLGLLHARTQFGFPNITVTQYWRSFDDLEAYARSASAAHLPAWAAFNRKVGSNGDVGIWHETYRVAPGTYENVYNNMPAFGLGAAAPLQSARDARNAARQRMSRAG